MQDSNGPKKFMGLGGGMFSRSMVQQWGNMPMQPYAPMPIYAGSMIMDMNEPQKSLPDIYTTCPDLKKYPQMTMIVAAPQPNEFNLPRAIPVPMGPPPPQLTAPPPMAPPPQLAPPPQMVPQGAMWRAPHMHAPRPPPQVIMKFDPHAPIIRPYVRFFLCCFKGNFLANFLNNIKKLFNFSTNTQTRTRIYSSK